MEEAGKEDCRDDHVKSIPSRRKKERSEKKDFLGSHHSRTMSFCGQKGANNKYEEGMRLDRLSLTRGREQRERGRKRRFLRRK